MVCLPVSRVTNSVTTWLILRFAFVFGGLQQPLDHQGDHHPLPALADQREGAVEVEERVPDAAADDVGWTISSMSLLDQMAHFNQLLARRGSAPHNGASSPRPAGDDFRRGACGRMWRLSGRPRTIRHHRSPDFVTPPPRTMRCGFIRLTRRGQPHAERFGRVIEQRLGSLIARGGRLRHVLCA